MALDERWFAVAMDFVLKHGTSWEFWAVTSCFSLLAILWRVKRFRFLIEYNARD